MSKNTKKTEQKVTKSNEITKATIAKTIDNVAISVAEQDGKATGAKKTALLSLIGGEKKFNAATDAEKRKTLDLCTSAINERIDTLKTENKSVPKEERKPLKESPLYNGLRSLLGLASAMRSRLRTDAEKESDKKKAEKARRENEEKIIQAAIQAGKVIFADDDIPNVKTSERAEELIFSVYAKLTASGLTSSDWIRMTKACTMVE